MTKKSLNENVLNMVIENHKTASWANIETMKQQSNVPIPSVDEVLNAKEYVEVNQK